MAWLAARVGLASGVALSPSSRSVQQYSITTRRLAARIALHAYGTNPQDWFSWLDGRLPLHGDVLDVGAGTGDLWSRIDHRQRGLRLTLADNSPAMCRQLHTIPDAHVQHCDATDLPFADHSFDTVIANHMLYHLDDPDAGLAEFARVLRPGGRLAVAVNGRGHLAELGTLATVIGRGDLVGSATLSDVTADTCPALIARRFHDITVERYRCDLAVPAPEPILAYLASLTDEPLTPAQQTTARDHIQARIDTHGRYPISKDTVLVTAHR